MAALTPSVPLICEFTAIRTTLKSLVSTEFSIAAMKLISAGSMVVMCFVNVIERGDSMGAK